MNSFLFNTTFTVSTDMRLGWLKWIDEVYEPEMRRASGVESHELYVIDGSLRDGAESFSSQWRCESVSQLGALRQVSSRLCQEMVETHGEKCLAFSTMMKKI